MKKRQIRKIQEDPSQLSLFRKINEWTMETCEIWKWTNYVLVSSSYNSGLVKRNSPNEKSQVHSETKSSLSIVRKLSLGFRCDLSFLFYFIFNFLIFLLLFQFRISNFYFHHLFYYTIFNTNPPRSLNLRASILLLCDSAGSHFPRFCFHGSTSLPHFLSPKDRNNSLPSPPQFPRFDPHS